MNTERALGTFFNEINKAIDVSKKPVQDVLNYYLSVISLNSISSQSTFLNEHKSIARCNNTALSISSKKKLCN
jgi:hypothetical protein